MDLESVQGMENLGDPIFQNILKGYMEFHP